MADDSQIIKDPSTGAVIGASDQYAFNQDPLGDRGWLRYPYQVGLLIFLATSSVWNLQRTLLTFSDSGLGDIDDKIGGSVAQTETETSLFPGGYFGTSAYATVRGFGVSASSAPYSAELVGTGVNATAPFVGNTRNDCVGIAGLMLQSALQGSDFEFSQNGRTCQSLLGPAEQNPSGFGVASQNDTTVGQTIGCAARIKMRRPIVTPPASSNAIGYVWEQHFNSPLGVSADPSFAAPANNQVCILKERITWDMYFSDKQGLPLVMTGAMVDYFEQDIANGSV